MIEIEMDKLRKVGIDPEKFKEYQVLCLPENLESTASAEELFDASDTADLSKRLKAAGLKCANSFDLGIDTGVLERRGADLWLGLVWVIDNLAIPIIVGVLSSLLAAIIYKKSKSISPTMKQTKPQVHLSLHLQKGQDLTKLRYDGDPETLIELISGIGKDKEIEENKHDR